MYEEFSELMETLAASVEKNGEKPLTNLWLLNILKKVEKNLDYKDNLPDIGDDPNW